MAELTSAFRFNDAVLRHLIIKRDNAVVEPSLMARAKDEHDERDSERRARHNAAAANAENTAGDTVTEDAA